MRKCDVDGCDNKHHGLGYCEIHYRRVRVHGDVHKVLQVYNRDRKQSSKPHPRGEDHHAWKGDEATDMSKRRRAIRMYDLTDCEKCGKPGTDRHHLDENTGNNEPDNIMILCVRCHCHIHGKHINLAEATKNKPTKPPIPCIVCGELHKPTRKGKCYLCYNYLRQGKGERPERLWHTKPKFKKGENRRQTMY